MLIFTQVHVVQAEGGSGYLSTVFAIKYSSSYFGLCCKYSWCISYIDQQAQPYLATGFEDSVLRWYAVFAVILPHIAYGTNLQRHKAVCAEHRHMASCLAHSMRCVTVLVSLLKFNSCHPAQISRQDKYKHYYYTLSVCLCNVCAFVLCVPPSSL